MNKLGPVLKLVFGPMSLKKNPYLFLIQFIVLIFLAVTIIPNTYVDNIFPPS